jgi:ABC-2 type transport system ATP-binding protein
MSSETAAITTRSLTKQYGTTTAVDRLTFEVPTGVVYGFLGPNGAGKTTTMRMLTGLVGPTDGDGFVAGTHCTERKQLVRQIGLLPEEPPLYNELTGREQLQFAADLRNLSWDGLEDRAVGMAEKLGLAEDLNRRIGGYSKGMKQKTAFIQAVQHDPEVVFLDEPTSGLDPRAARALRELITELTAEETTVFLSTHILPVVEEIADQVGVLYDGQLVSEGSPAELTASVGDEAGLEEAFLEVTDREAAPWGR